MDALKSLDFAWKKFGNTRVGRQIISRLIGRLIPYTGSVHPEIIELRAGYARIRMKDRRKLRNHLGSLHAIALVNLGELASGLALNLHLVGRARAIVTSITIDYKKKARGTITAEAEVPCPSLSVESMQIVTSTLRDPNDEIVANVRVTWNLRP